MFHSTHVCGKQNAFRPNKCLIFPVLNIRMNIYVILRHLENCWKKDRLHIHKFQELKYGPGDCMYVVGSDVSTAHVNEEPRGRLCSVSSRSSRIFFFQSTFRAWYPVRRDIHRRRPSLPLYAISKLHIATHFEFTTCGLWPSLFSFHRTSHWLSSTIDTRYSRRSGFHRVEQASARVHVFDACVRAYVVRRRRTRDEKADRPVDGNVDSCVGEFSEPNKSRQVECVAVRVAQSAPSPRPDSPWANPFAHPTKVSGPPCVTIDIASLDFRDPAGKFRRHAKNIEPRLPRIFSWLSDFMNTRGFHFVMLGWINCYRRR